MRGTACSQSVSRVPLRLLRAVTVFLPTGLIVKAQLKNVEKTRFIILILGAHLLLEAITV